VSVRICEMFFTGRNVGATTETLPNTLLNLSQLKQNDTSIAIYDALNSVNGQMRFITNGHQKLYMDDLLTQFQIASGGTFEVFGLNNSSQFYMDHNQTILNYVDVSIQRNLTIAQNLTIAGNLTVNGTKSIFNTQTIEVQDNTIKLATNNSADIVDSGFYTVNSTNKYSGLIRRASDKIWYLTESSTSEPLNGSSLDVSTLGTFQVGKIISPLFFFDNINSNFMYLVNGAILFIIGGLSRLVLASDNINTPVPIFSKKLYYVASTGPSNATYNVSFTTAIVPLLLMLDVNNRRFTTGATSGDFGLIELPYKGYYPSMIYLTNPLFNGQFAKFTWTIVCSLPIAGVMRFQFLRYTNSSISSGTDVTASINYEANIMKSSTIEQIVQLDTTLYYSLVAEQFNGTSRSVNVVQIDLNIVIV
jgi:hypothetical protein